MKYNNIKEKYNSLIKETINSLRHEINKSSIYSIHMNILVIPVNVFDYRELGIVNDKLTFIDTYGLHYELFDECSIEDLIDILNNL